MRTVILLTLSNVFMTFAWYFHRENKSLKTAPLWIVILVSWGIAFFEYCFQVPANRLGHERGFTIAQLKIMQEVITLCVFVPFTLYFFPDEKLAWNHAVGLGLVMAAVFVVYHKW
jgi:uncharacterized protein (DUF486 family)